MGKKVKWILSLTGLIVLIVIFRSITSGGNEEVVVKEEFPLVEISSHTQGSLDSDSPTSTDIRSYSGSGDTTLDDVIIKSGVLIYGVATKVLEISR